MNPPTDLNALPLPALFDELSRDGLIRRLLELARDEDLGVGPHRGDITSEAWTLPAERVRASLAAREGGVAAGLAAVPMLVELFAPGASFRPSVSDGEHFQAGAVLGVIEGPSTGVLALERTMLNLVGRLSGVATLTRRFVEASSAGGAGGGAKVYDTRKTTPGLRRLEKYAVRCGGGCCHRLGLHDAMLVKDNHLASVPLDRLTERAAESAARARANRPLRFVEFEADRLEQVDALLHVKRGLIDVILLDNMPPALLREAVALRDRVNPSMLLEASGGVTLETIRAIAETGVERISCGSLTHSAVSLDLGLDVEAC